MIGSLPLRSCRRDELFIIDVKKCSMYAAKSQVDLNLVPTHSLFIFIRLFDDDTTKKKKKKNIVNCCHQRRQMNWDHRSL